MLFMRGILSSLEIELFGKDFLYCNWNTGMGGDVFGVWELSGRSCDLSTTHKGTEQRKEEDKDG